MTHRHDELSTKEETGWRSFLDVVNGVPPDRLAEEGVVPGWSVKDLVWHCAEWARFAGKHLQQMRDGVFVDPFEGVDPAHWDRVSQEMIDESRSMSFDEVLAGAEVRRAAVRDTLMSLSAVDDEVARWFADETFSHYDEHGAEIRLFLDATG